MQCMELRERSMRDVFSTCAPTVTQVDERSIYKELPSPTSYSSHTLVLELKLELVG